MGRSTVSRPTVYQSLPVGTRPMPDVARYDQLLTGRPGNTSAHYLAPR